MMPFFAELLNSLSYKIDEIGHADVRPEASAVVILNMAGCHSAKTSTKTP